MTRKQLQSLISAGVFSAALLSGVAYADDAPATSNPPAPAAASGSTANQPTAASATDPQPAPTNQDTSNAQNDKAKASDSKGPAPHGCAGAGGCSSGSDSK